MSTSFAPKGLHELALRGLRGCGFVLESQVEKAYQPVMHALTISLQALVAASVFFVWVVRYANIVQEFKQYGLPDWLRDLVGILKMTFALMLLIGIERGLFAVMGGIGIAILMGAAVVTHLRVKNPVFKMLPSLTLLLFSTAIALINYQLLAR
jgi:uncharacterized membrane protein YphA (DoxX/SURF4 family)